MSDEMMLLLLNSGAALVVVAAALPMWLGWIGPNRFWGFRTPRTLSDDKVWYAANRYAGIGLTLGGVLMGVLSGVSAAVPETFSALMALIGSGVVLTVAVMWSFVKASAYVADLDASPESIGLTANTEEDAVPTEVAPERNVPPRTTARP